MKRSQQAILASGILTAIVFGADSQAQGQGLIQRLRERISVQLQNQQQPRPGANPATDRTAPNQPNPGTPAPANPSSRYRNPAGGDGPTFSPIAPRTALPPSNPDPNLQTPRGRGNVDRGVQQAFGASVLQSMDQNDGDQASIGITGSNARAGQYSGVQITGFLPHSQANRGGLREGDYIFMLNGAVTPSINVLANELRRYQPGDQVTLRVGQNGVVKDIEIRLVGKSGAANVASPSELNSPEIGTSLEPSGTLFPAPSIDTQSSSSQTPRRTISQPDNIAALGAEIAVNSGQRGVVIKSLAPNEVGVSNGLRAGDRIISLDGRMVADGVTLEKQLAMIDGVYELGVIRQDDLVQISIDPNKAAVSDAAAASGNSGEAGSLLGGFGAMFGRLGNANVTNKAPAEVVDELPAPPEVDVLALEQDFPAPSKGAPSKAEAADESSDSSKAEIKDEIKRLSEKLRELEAKLETAE
ncbi:PDZ domain-containing protein [Rhodopirellula sp. MGV]|uniref:PDZ domain-containing protein n=1 Tax=Rhodopirellula sp. MGV TaxID=2023130 RepID=UPI000B95E1B2|nr:PDZ domain-containing protein [Rhodopirellula sp. MGV]OYP34238.1 hypothetical protein CGZ80_15765 [Rhodopirellula sp. MGV]PNY35017.1 PDZ domain-containing protein [Rhodopirellula baltica]